MESTPVIKIYIAILIILAGLFMFRQTHEDIDFIAIIGGLVYLYIRWHSYKRSRHLARMNQ